MTGETTETVTAEVQKQTNNYTVQYAFLNNSFFLREFNDSEEILDHTKSKEAREKRVYVCIKIEWEGNTFLLPLRRVLPDSILYNKNQKFKQTYYRVPSSTKPKAGLDFRKIIIANDPSTYRIEEAKIASSQKKIIHDNFEEINNMAIAYIKGFIKAAKKNRQKREPLYNRSALNNFLSELGI